MRTAEGVVTIVQEGRFQLVDAGGVAHLFLLGYRAAAEPEQLPALQQRQARVRVRFHVPCGLIARVATQIQVLD